MTTDPFESLAQPPVPLAPRPAFAAELRRKLAGAFGTTPPGQGASVPEVREYTPARLHSLTPYLSCLHAEDAIAWYQEVFDAQMVGEPIIMDDGRVGHAELTIGATRLMLADEYPEYDVRSPDTLGGSPVLLHLTVPDVDGAFARALAERLLSMDPLTLAMTTSACRALENTLVPREVTWSDAELMLLAYRQNTLRARREG